jgi:hypothetical protein
MNAIDVLPSPKSPEFLGGKIYFHVLLSPTIIERLKMTAHVRGYKPGPFLEELLNNVLPKKVRTKTIKRQPAKISLVRSKESR